MARHDSLDSGGELYNRCERLYDAIPHDEYDDGNRQGDGRRNDCGDDCAISEYDDDSCDNLSMCNDGNSVDSDSNTK